MEMTMPLDPLNLTPAASLNRVRFVALPGLDLPPEMIGRTAYEFLAARSLERLSLEFGEAGAASQYGRWLGWLLVTLLRGDQAARAIRSDWDASYWEHWSRIQTVWLGGGLASSGLGAGIAEQATTVLRSVGMRDRSVRVAPWPAHLPLVGAARAELQTAGESSAAMGTQTALVLDFGTSYVKRGRATYADGRLVRLTLLPRLPARWTESPSDRPDIGTVGRLGAFMAETIATSWTEVKGQHAGASDRVCASFASYIRDGQPLPRQGGPYAALLALSGSLDHWLSERASELAGHTLRVRLLHDGTAAALSLAGMPSVAVVMLGTSLGVGFPPASGAEVPLAPGFAVDDGKATA